MRTSIHAALLLGTALCAIGLAPGAFAQVAQGMPASGTTDTIETGDADITVTARKRDESIVDVPLAITVVTAARLEKLDINSTSDLANYVPGLQFSDFTPLYSRNDRGATRPLIFRGLTLGTGGSVSSAGGLFLDGAAVVGNEVPGGLDIGAVEVLRGPQSVYFGRSTMTGAVSYRTKAIPDHWMMEAELNVGERRRVDAEVSVAGPVVQDLLGVRVTALAENAGGYVRNDFDGSTLGDRSRKSISATIDVTPAATFEIKGYANYFKDVDGPSATAFVPATRNNCRLPNATRTTFCGEIPGRSNSINYFNTVLPIQAGNYILSSPLLKDAGFSNRLGLQREVVNSHVVATWQASDYFKVESITGYHTNVVAQAADGKSAPQNVQGVTEFSRLYFYSANNRARDFSQELRVTSDPARQLSWTLGGNYISAYDQTNPLLYYNSSSAAAPTVYVDRFVPSNINTQQSKTYGVFGGAYLKLIDERLTLSAEGRYQWDGRRAHSDDPFTGARVTNTTFSRTFRSFNPRVSAGLDIGGGARLYTSYATGTRPGGFNGSIASAIQRAGAAAVEAAFGLSSPAFGEERLKIGEVGLKGTFGGNRGYYDLNAYYGKLTDQQISYTVVLPGEAFTTAATANVGRATAYGIEAQGSYAPLDGLSVSGTFAWNHTRRDRFDNFSAIPQFGTRTLDGVEFANAPEFSGSAVVSYEVPVSADWKAFTTGSYVYRGKQYVDIGNAAHIAGRSQVDARIGVSDERLSLELYVTNVFDNQDYTGGTVSANFDNLTYHAFFGAWAPPRTVGTRIRVKI